MLPSEIPNSPWTCLWEGFLLFGNLSFFTTPSPGQVFVLNSFVSLSVFYILSYLLLKRLGGLSGLLVSSAMVQNLFCESWLAFKWSFDKFVGEKAVSLSYSSAILGPPPYQWFFFLIVIILQWLRQHSWTTVNNTSIHILLLSRKISNTYVTQKISISW